MSRYRRIDGKVHPHFYKSRIYNYGFEGNKYEAKEIGKAFLKLADSPNGFIAMSLNNLDKTSLSSELYRKTEKIIIENLRKDKELFLKVEFGRIVNILEARLKREQNKGRYLRLPRIRRFRRFKTWKPVYENL